MQKNNLKKGMGDSDLKISFSFYASLGNITLYSMPRFKNKRKNPVKRYKLRSSKSQESTLTH